MRTAEFDYCYFSNGIFSRWVHFETDSCDWTGLTNDVLFEDILSVEAGDGLLTVTTRPSEATRQRILEEEYAGTEDSEKIQMRVVYVLDAATLELLSLTDYDTMPNGEEELVWEMRFAYDVDLPHAEEIDAIRAHLQAAADHRTTTFVFDEGTAYEATYVYSTPVGDGCTIPQEITKDGIPYQIDPERSTLTNEARDNDAVLYLDRIAED